METYLTKLYTVKGHRKCYIIERSKKDDNKIRTIETIEGFCVSFSYTVHTQKFLVDIGWLISKRDLPEIFEYYCSNLRLKDPIIDRLPKSDFLKSIYQPEIDNLVKFKKYIDLFIEYEKQKSFLNICETFIEWLKTQNIERVTHDHIFANIGFELFEYLIENYIGVKGKGRHMDINYFYHRMKKDNYIIVSPTEFRDWYNDIYEENYQLKTELETKTNDNKRYNNYSLALSQFSKQ